MEEERVAQAKKRCRFCGSVLEPQVSQCPVCGCRMLSEDGPPCFLVGGGPLGCDTVVTPTRKSIERALSQGLLSPEQGEFLLDLLIRVRHLHFHKRAEICRVISRNALETDPDGRRQSKQLDDTIHGLFVTFGL